MKRQSTSLKQLVSSRKSTIESRKRRKTLMFCKAKRRRKTMVAGLYLPDDCWECVFKFFNNDNGCLNSLSIVSKQFHSITNRLRFSLTIYNLTLPFLPTLFHKFTNLTSLDLSRFHGNLNKLLCQISQFPLKLTLLNLSNQPIIPTIGLRDFSKKITTLTSLICSRVDNIYSLDLLLISDFFPLLEILDLSYPLQCNYYEVELSLFKLRKVNLSGHYHINKLPFHMFKNCKLLEEAIMFNCFDTTFAGIASALCERPTLRSLSFSNTFGPVNETHEKTYVTSHFIYSLVSLKYLTSLDLLSSNISDELLFSIANEGLPLTRLVLQNCIGYSYSGIFYLLSSKCQHFQHLDLENAGFLIDKHVMEMSLLLGDLVSINLTRCSMLTDSAFFALLRNCPSLSDIKMEHTCIGQMTLESCSTSLMDNFVACPQLKYLRLAHNPWLCDEDITMFASIFPNLQLLDLSNCCRIFEEGIAQVLSICCNNIRYLNISHCSIVKLEMKFELPKLEVLNLSYTKVDDETLFMISKSCGGLLKLSLKNCNDVTKTGVKHVVENCTQLRKISLYGCHKVNANVVAFMVSSRPTLRKITAPTHFSFSDKKKKYFLRHGCIVR